MPITQYNSSVRQMSQSKFNSMKNASGKIPDLANQIVMTNSEDTNISCLRTEVVYDMTSSDANINWGYTSGIQGNVEVIKDLTKYQYIDIVPQVYKLGATNTGGWSGVYRLDLTSQRVSGDWYVATYTTAYADAAGEGGITNAVWKIVFYYQLTSKTFKWLVQFNGTSYNNNSNSVITKIYGVLKTPSMIYTGDELIAGNGIKIENGVISSNLVSENKAYGSYSFTASGDYKTDIVKLPNNQVITDGGVTYSSSTGEFTIPSGISKIEIFFGGKIYCSNGNAERELGIHIDGVWNNTYSEQAFSQADMYIPIGLYNIIPISNSSTHTIRLWYSGGVPGSVSIYNFIFGVRCYK